MLKSSPKNRMAIRMTKKLVITRNTRPHVGSPTLSDIRELPNLSHKDRPMKDRETWDIPTQNSNLITLRFEKSTKIEMKTIRYRNLERRNRMHTKCCKL